MKKLFILSLLVFSLASVTTVYADSVDEDENEIHVCENLDEHSIEAYMLCTPDCWEG